MTDFMLFCKCNNGIASQYTRQDDIVIGAL